MGSLAQSRRFTIASGALAAIRARFSADRADEEETAATIRTLRREADYLLDPHSAVAFAVAEKEAGYRSVPMVVLSTAHPGKFPEAVARAAGIVPQLPAWLADLADRPERVKVLPADQNAVEHFILGASRAAQGAAA
jgi:threonine synthase